MLVVRVRAGELLEFDEDSLIDLNRNLPGIRLPSHSRDSLNDDRLAFLQVVAQYR